MSVYRITTRNNKGEDSTLRVEADTAIMDNERLVLKKAGNIVGSFISVISFLDESIEQQG